MLAFFHYHYFFICSQFYKIFIRREKEPLLLIAINNRSCKNITKKKSHSLPLRNIFNFPSLNNNVAGRIDKSKMAYAAGCKNA